MLVNALPDAVNRRCSMFFKKKCPSCGTKNPINAATCASCGASFESRKADSPQSIKDYDEAIRLDPQSAEAHYKRGFAYQNMGQGERAIEDFDRAIRINPEFAMAYSNRGYAYLNKGQYDRAVVDCTKAIKLDPSDAVAYLNRGTAYKLQGNTAEAAADLEKVITLSENPRLIEMASKQIQEIS